MTDDFKRGLIMGLAMQPLCVVAGGGGGNSDNYCNTTIILLGSVYSDEGYCRYIEF